MNPSPARSESAGAQSPVVKHAVTTLAQTALTSGRALPVVDPLMPLLPDGGLVRGKAVSCGGAASMSLALALAVEATASGAWLAIVDVPTFGLEAAGEFGIPLERVVRVDPPSLTAAKSARPAKSAKSGGVGDTWSELMAAVVDGFEVVITSVPQRLNPGLARRVQSRLRAREAVMIALGRPGPVSVDTELTAADPQWEGVADGWGYLRGRRVTVTSSGRRVPRPQRITLWLPGPDGKVAAVDETVTGIWTSDRWCERASASEGAASSCAGSQWRGRGTQ